jgi:hypothetical protein
MTFWKCASATRRAREISQNWNVNVSFAGDDPVVEQIIFDAEKAEFVHFGSGGSRQHAV